MPTTTDPRQTQQQQMPQMQQPIFLSGKVQMDDGAPPPEPVLIERVCGGQPRPEAYTDSKGRFSFELGRRLGVLPDASTSSDDPFENNPAFGGGRNRTAGVGSMGGGFGGGTMNRVNLMGCELRAALPGYQSTIVQLGNRNALDNPDVGMILLRRLGNREGNTISATNALAPKDAKKSYDKAREQLKKKKVEDAEKELTKAVELYPKYAAAWLELGRINEGRNNADEARKCFNKAIEADPKYVYPYEGLYRLAAREKNWELVAENTQQVLKLDPFDFPQAMYYNAVANLNLQRLDEAEKSARSFHEKQVKAFPKANHLLGLVLAQKGDFAQAKELLQQFLATNPSQAEADQVKTQLAEIDKLANAK